MAKIVKALLIGFCQFKSFKVLLPIEICVSK